MEGGPWSAGNIVEGDGVEGGQRRLPGRCRGPRGGRPLCISCESPGSFERDSVIPRLEGLGAVVVLVVILVVVVGGGSCPEGIRTHSHLHVWFFTPSLPGCPRGALFRGEMLYLKAWFSVEGWWGGPYLQTDLILIPVAALTCK